MMSSFFEKAFEGKNKWYTYLFVLLISFIGGQFIGSIPFVIYSAFTDINIEDSTLPISNLTFAFILFVYVIIFWFFVQSVNGIQEKRITSIVTGRAKIDIKRIFVGVMIWGAIISVAFFTELPFTDGIEFRFEASSFIPLFFICLIMIPFQSTFEELVFRGSLMQGSYLLFKKKWIALIVTSILFALMHGANPEVETHGFWIAMSVYFIMGLTLGGITILDNGMELAIGMHFINNFFGFTMISTEGNVYQNTSSMFVQGHSPIELHELLFMSVGCLLFIFIAKYIYKFKFSNSQTVH